MTAIPSTSKHTDDISMEPSLLPSPMQQMIAASSGALFTSLFATPLDVLKIRLQGQQRPLVTGRCFLYSNGLMDHLCTCVQTNAADCDWYIRAPRPSKFTGTLGQQRPLVTGRCFLYSNGLMDHLCTCVQTNPADCDWYIRAPRPSKFTGTLDAFVKIVRYEGVSSLWSGLPPTLVMAVPATVFYFTSYDALNRRLSEVWKGRSWTPMLAGATARLCVVTVINPLEMVRTKLQSERLSYKEVAKAVRSSISYRGWRTFGQGWAPTVMRDVPFSAVYWGSYEFFKSTLIDQFDLCRTNFHVSFVSGALSGTIAALVTTPFDVIKTHRQIEIGERMAQMDKRQPSSTAALLLRLYKQQGFRSIFAGTVPRLIKVAPACAIMIGTYEYGKLFFQDRNRRAQSSAVLP